MDSMELQSKSNNICKAYGIPIVPIKTNNGHARNGGLACYCSYRIRGQKRIHPKCIIVYNWFSIYNQVGEIAYVLGHELAHHILTVKKNSTRHTNEHGKLSDDIAVKLSRLLK